VARGIGRGGYCYIQGKHMWLEEKDVVDTVIYQDNTGG